jgi:hypothetical protein
MPFDISTRLESQSLPGLALIPLQQKLKAVKKTKKTGSMFIKMAEILIRSVRKLDTTARLGGDEFTQH